ncbi:MAG: glycosyltransferase, partial [Panacibacter sp.]
MKKTVWLASWFPNENDPLVGDFIKRHAEAVSLFQPVHVIHVEKIKYGFKTIKTTDPLFTNLTYIVKYYSVWYLAGIERLYSYLYSLWLYHSLLKQYIKENGKPDLLHVHVTFRCGWVALYYKLVHKIPYIITEHNAGYMPLAKLYHKSAVNILNVLPLKLIIKNAATVTTVSKALLNALQQQFNLNNFQVIYNVVNTDIFFPGKATPENKKPVFLHISTLTPQKNPEQMFTAFALLRQQYNTNFTLCIVAPKKQHLIDICKELHIDDCIEWHAETSQQNIAGLMHHANALVLYSNFESFGCVNIEAMACGLPVIVSGLEVFKEYLQPNATAWFAEPGNPEQLALTMHEFLLAPKQPPQLIAQKAQAFSYQIIGEKFVQLYETIN